MPRIPLRSRSIAAIFTASTVILYLACDNRTIVTTPVGNGKSVELKPAQAPKPESAPTKLFADWSPEPQGVLIISGEANGYLQPCGCASGQMGGLGRRHHLFEKIHAQKWPTAAIDLGNLVYKPTGALGGLDQEKIKFGIAVKALASMKYDAIALSPEDLKLGVDEVLAQLLNIKGGPKFLSANVVPVAGFEEAVRPSTIAKAGEITIGVTAIMSPDWFKSLVDPARDTLLSIKTPEEVLPAVLAELEKTSQFQVLMVQGPDTEATRLAELYPGFDIVVSTADLPEPGEKPKAVVNNGKTMIVNAGQKGKHVIGIGLYPGQATPLKYRRVSLNSGYKETESMRVLIDEEYQSILKSVGIVENFPRKPNVEGAPGATYVGAQNCKYCHPNTFLKWSNSKHAQGFEALVNNPKRNREFDAECITCHTTGFTYLSGWVSAQATPYLKGNQCENCHGPGSKHVSDPDNKDFRKFMARTADAADKNGLCSKCHDEDNDPNWNFQKYYPQIFHTKLDTYEDPKVYKGITPKLAVEAEPKKVESASK